VANSKAAPVSASIFAYQVGFGDCFLLRFTYADASQHHILIDFGTTKLPENSSPTHMVDVANDIKAKCGGRLDAVVATHRHADHISGFATQAGGKGSGDIIASLVPQVVLQPWTEALDAPEQSLGPDPDAGKLAFAKRKSSLAAMEEVAKAAVRSLDARQFPHSRMKGLADQIRFIGEDNISNVSAVRNLSRMGKKNVYGFHGGKSGIASLLPGVKVDVLGPPTLHQTDTIRKQRSRDKDEFWQLAPKRVAAAMGVDGSDSRLFPDAPIIPGGKPIAEQRWLIDRIDAANAEQLLGIVTALDDQMNNTSLILLFRAGSKTILFPGDAQLENWEYALQSKLAPLLDNVDVYKVGHHGSLNATPKSLWKRFAKRGNKGREDRLTSVLSTLKGKHGCAAKHTEVPRKTLVDALTAESNLHTTETISELVLCEEVVIDLR
jgi:hypothetical protein